MNSLSLKSFRVWGICVFQFLMRAAINILFVTSQSAFFIVAGVDKLPYVYTAMNIIYISLQFFSINSLKGSSGDYIKKIAAIFLGLLMIRFLFLPQASTAVTIFYLLLVMIFDLFFGQFFSHFLNEIFPLQDGKKLLPMITGFGSLSFIISGFIIKLCLNVMSVNSLVGIGIAIFASGLAILFFYTKSHGESRKGEAGTNSDKDIQGEKGISFFSFSALGRLIIAMTFVNMLGKYWMDFQYSRAITGSFNSPESLAGFIAIYSSIVDALVLLSQMSFAGILFRKFGLVNVTRLLPAIVLPLTLLAVAKPSFWYIIGAQFCYTFLIKSFYNSSSTLFMGAFQSRQRMKLMSVNGIFASSGAMIAGLSLIAFQSYISTTQAFALLAVVFAIMLWMCMYLNKAYAKELETCLEQVNKETSPDLIKAILSLKDKKIRASYLNELFQNDDEEIRIQALKQAGPAQTEEETKRLLHLIYHDRSFKVRSLAIKQLANSRNPDLGKLAQELFKNDKTDPRLIANLIESISTQSECCVSEEFFFSLLESAHHRIRSASALALIRLSNSAQTIERSLRCLWEMLYNKERPEFQIAGMVSLIELGNPVFAPQIAQLIWSDDETVATTAIRSICEFPSTEVIQLLDNFAGKTKSETLRNITNSQLQRLKSMIKNDFHSLLDNLTLEERLSISKKMRALKEDDIEIFQRIMRLDNAGLRKVFWETLSHHKTKLLSELLSIWLLEINEEVTFVPEQLPEDLSTKIISDTGFQSLMTRLLKEKLLDIFDLLLSIQQRLLVYRMLIKARSNKSEISLQTGEEIEKQLVTDMTVLLNFLAARCPNPAKVLEALEWIQSDDAFVKSTGLEYLEYVVPTHLQKEFLPVLLYKKQPELLIKEIEKNAEMRPMLAQEKRKLEKNNAD